MMPVIRAFLTGIVYLYWLDWAGDATAGNGSIVGKSRRAAKRKSADMQVMVLLILLAAAFAALECVLRVKDAGDRFERFAQNLMTSRTGLAGSPVRGVM